MLSLAEWLILIKQKTANAVMDMGRGEHTLIIGKNVATMQISVMVPPNVRNKSANLPSGSVPGPISQVLPLYPTTNILDSP